MEPRAEPLTADEKRALLARLMSERAARPRRAPLSQGQGRLWRLLSIESESPVYNIGFAYEIRGPLDPEAMGRSIAAMAKRHESLRSSFEVADGEPAVIVAPEAVVTHDQVDLTGLAPAEQDAEVGRRVDEAARRPFDLSRAPLWRFLLIRRGPESFTMALTTHHILADRWSVGIFIQELSAEYRAQARGEPSTLTRPAGSYTEAARQIESSVPEAELRAQLDYWRETFGEDVPDLLLPNDLAPSSAPTYGGARRSFALPESLAARLDALAVEAGVTPYVAMLSALAARLHRDTGQDDLVIVTPVSGRHRGPSRGVIGYFNNLLPLRLDLSGRPTFRDLLATADRAVRGAFEHQDAPFHRIVEAPGLRRINPTRCTFSLQNTTSLGLDLPGIASTHDDVATGTSNFDLAVFLEAHDGSYRGLVDAKSDLWSPGAIDGFVARFQDLLRAAVEAPDAAIDDLPDRLATAPATPRDRPQPGGSPARAGDRPRNDMERRLSAIWEDVMGLRPLGPSSHFFALGGHSMMAARLVERIGREVGRELPLAALLHAPTIREFSDMILNGDDAPCWGSLVPIQPNGSLPPLFCVHGGGGGVLSYGRLAEALGDDQPLLGLQAPRHETADHLPIVEELASLYIQAIRTAQPEGPYHLAGHSFGGLVAFEMARRLVAEGREVGLLVVIDMTGPDAKVTRLDRVRLALYALSQLEPRQKLRYVVDRLSWRIQKDRRMPLVVRKLANMMIRGYTWNESERRLKVINASMEALQSYKPLPYSGRLTLIRAKVGSQAINSDPLGGWGRTALGGVEVRDFECTHMQMLERPNVNAVGRAITECLARSRAARSAPAEPSPAAAG